MTEILDLEKNTGAINIACIGTGFVGVVTAIVFAKIGHNVVGLDIDKEKINSLSKGKTPFYEPHLSKLLSETLKNKNLSFTDSYKKATSRADVIFIMVGTPSAPDGQADLKYIIKASESIAKHIKDNAIIVIKSTVPPSTNKKVEKIVSAHTQKHFTVASVPEFLKEGSAVENSLHPQRVLIGSNDNNTIEILTKLHKPLTENIIVMKPESAQMAKYAGNVYLAQRITFINQIADLCEKNGADIQEVIQGIGTDKRIGEHYWYPGLGYGGSCFPKDVKEIAAYSKAVGEADSLFIKIDELNEKRAEKLMTKYDEHIGGFEGKTVAVLGLSFKPNTNDMRKSPALEVIPFLLSKGATVHATDPQTINDAKNLLP